MALQTPNPTTAQYPNLSKLFSKEIILELELLVKRAVESAIKGVGKADLSEKKEVMNIHEVAKYTGFSTATIYKFTKNKEIPFEKNISKRLQFSKKEIDAWFATGNHKPYTKE